MDYLRYFAALGSNSEELISLMSNLINEKFPNPVIDEFQKRGWEKLGEGYYLVPLPDLDSKRGQYSYLYKGEEKISDVIFRTGGMFSGWNGDYVQLIMYTEVKPRRTGKPPKKTYDKNGELIVVKEFSSGTHCIVNKEGDIVYMMDNMLGYPYLQGGCLMSVNNRIVNLKSGIDIIKYNGSSLRSDKFLFVENTYNKEYQKGVYKIEFETGSFEIFNLTK